MSDNVAVTAGAGTTIATDLIGGVHHQRVKAGWGAEGAFNDTSATDPLPVDIISSATLTLSGEDHIGQVGGAVVVVRPAITVTAGAYSANDVVGGELTLTGAMRVTSGSGVLQSLVIHDAAAQNKQYDLYIFDSAPGAALADNDAFAWTAGDEDKLLTVIRVAASDWFTAAGDGFCVLRNLGAAVKGNGGTALYLYIVAVTAPTYAATTDLTLALTFLQD
jgi:hypothetical protein